MAEKDRQTVQTPEPIKNDQTEKPGGCLHSIITVLLALLVVAVVSAGVFYFFVKNNINGIADTLRPQIRNYPVLKYLMPKDMPEYDPDDPKYLTDKQILDKYIEYRERVKNLDESLALANSTIEEMKRDNQGLVEAEAALEENKRILEAIDIEKEALEQDKKMLAELISRGDKEGFKEYFQKVDKATAETIYAEIMKEFAIDEEKAALAKPFSTMDPQRAANMLSELYVQDTETLLDILEGMESKIMAPILERMDVKIAAGIYKMLSDRKLSRKV